MPDRDEVRKLIKEIDQNNNGLIEKDELQVMVVSILRSMTEKEDEDSHKY